MDKFFLQTEDALLMVIDIQEKLVPAMKYGDKVTKNINTLIAIARALEIPIVVTEQYPKGLGATIPEIKNNLGEILIYEKVSFTACTDEVKAVLSQLGRKKIIITGMETHVCVFQTVRDLLKEGFQVFLPQDAVCSRTKDNYRNGLSLISDMGAVITNTETILFDLMKKAGTPQFKELSKLIK